MIMIGSVFLGRPNNIHNHSPPHVSYNPDASVQVNIIHITNGSAKGKPNNTGKYD